MGEKITLPTIPQEGNPTPKRRVSTLSRQKGYPRILVKSIIILIKKIDTKTGEETRYKSHYLYNTADGPITIDVMIESSGGEKIGICIPYIKDISNSSKAQAIYHLLQMQTSINQQKIHKAILIYPMGLIEPRGKIGQIMEKYQDHIDVVNLSDKKSKKILDLATHPLTVEEWLDTDFFIRILQTCFPGQSLEFLKCFLMEVPDQ